jgi:tetratricopeptide (TPR) repeat protein
MLNALRAIALAPGTGRARAALAFVLQNRLDIARALKAYDAAYAASPDDANVLRNRGVLLGSLGDPEGLVLFQHAEALDPLRPRNPLERANTELNLQRYDDAIASARTYLATKPGDPQGTFVLATALLAKGRSGEALRAVAATASDDPFVLPIVAAATAATDRAASDRALATLAAKYGSNAQYQIAEVHAWRRQPDLAFAAIARAWDGLDPGLLGVKTDPLLAPIRTDPRYGEWLRKIGFP